MRLSRSLLATASSVSKQTKKITPPSPPASQYKQLLEFRSQWDVLYSAASCIHSLLSDQSKRDSLVSLIDDNVIRPDALGQADFGSALTLALHHDLTSDLFCDRAGEFCVKEFLKGVEPALERFHEVLYSLDLQNIAGIREKLQTIQSCDVSKSKSGNAIDTQKIERILSDQSTWISSAEKDPSSLVGQLLQMTSPNLLQAWEMQFTESVLYCYANMESRMEYLPESGQVTNVKFSSGLFMSSFSSTIFLPTIYSTLDRLTDARAREVEPFTKELKDRGEDFVSMSDDSFSSGIEKDHPVAAQIEVIYSISQCFNKRQIDNSNNQSSEMKNEEHQIQTSWVAVFETILCDSAYECTADDILRWKLIDNRPAWEFPSGLVDT
eukprot:CAMPEP_0204612148 /NCGR_PEP_ID=MMETSP0717-20131115/245_1 /ASSEMBLY_ACC=CAM_ASM_000666 /TAXON_ID=230516 /ORGANISM="Chaetoceros curvisetus" /LENGTH=380 /DNA_ID=CAMNT_0051624101 /DNA_START=39 /DNA_END=1181 /DNA_ORIENTATION=+